MVAATHCRGLAARSARSYVSCGEPESMGTLLLIAIMFRFVAKRSTGVDWPTMESAASSGSHVGPAIERLSVGK